MLNRVQFGNLDEQDSLAGDIHRVSQKYNASQGLPPIRGDVSNVVMPRRAHLQLGERFQQRPEWDASDNAQHSYDALEDETWKQLDTATRPRSKGGLGLSANIVPYDAYGRENKAQPFADHWENIIPEAKHDVAENHRLEALSTATTGGTPNFRNPETNDAFRVVHDLFGHIAGNRGVDRQGEEGAYQLHRQMYSPAARGALANQLREQVGYQQRFKSFPPLKHALGHDSGPMDPARFGENYADLRHEADTKSHAQQLLSSEQFQRRWGHEA